MTRTAMFERFSSGYYLGRLYVEPHTCAQAAIAQDAHERVTEQLYTAEGVERTDKPVVMKLGTTHFTVTGNNSVPTDTLVLPDRLLAGSDVRNPPTLAEVFLAKAERARQLLSVAEGLPAVESERVEETGATGGTLEGDGPDGPAGV